MPLPLRTRILRRLRAFTVLELLIVVVVVGILAALAMPKFQEALERAHLSAMQSDLRNFALQNELHREEFGSYANDANGDVAASGLWGSLQAWAGGASGTISSRVPRGFSYSRNVHNIFYRVSEEGWYKVVGHEKTGQTCAISWGPGETGTPVCPAPYQLQPQVTNARPAVGEEVIIDLADLIQYVENPANRVCPLTTSGDKCPALNLTITQVTWYLPDGTVWSPGLATGSLLRFVPAFQGRNFIRAVMSTSTGAPLTLAVPLEVGGSDEPIASALTPVPVISLPEDEIVAGEAAKLSCAGSIPDVTGSPITEATWTFADGSTLSGCEVEKTFSTSGPQPVTLTVRDADGNTSTTTQTVTVGTKSTTPTEQGPAAQVDVAYTPTNPKPGELITFQATTTYSGSLSYSWNFGDGTTATGATVTHSYPAPDTVAVVLTVSDGTNTGTKQVEVIIENLLPIPLFSFSPDNEPRGTTVTFDASASSDPDGTIQTYEWTFTGDVKKMGAVVTHQFTQPGTNTATLKVVDNWGASRSTSQAVQVRNQAPVASYTFSPDSAAEGTSITFTATASDADGDALDYAWDLGDGNVRTGATITHAYSQGGSYPVKLTVQDAYGAQTTVLDTVTVKANAAPVATFSFSPDNKIYGTTISFDASATTDPEGQTLSYAWDMGDFSVLKTGVTTTHSYAAPGNFSVRLIATDALGKADTVTQTVRVADNQPPSASFTASTLEPAIGASVSFDASASSDPEGEMLSYAWDFGDGTKGTGVTATHAYSVAGKYQVKLTVTDPKSLTGTTSQTLNVVSEPNNIAGLARWFRADAGVTHSFNNVSHWADQSGSGATASQTLSAESAKPLLVHNVINGRPVIRFNAGERDHMLVSQDISLSDFTLLVVQQTTADNVLLGHTGNNYQIRMGQSGGNTISLYSQNTGEGPVSNTLSKARTAWSVVGYQRQSGTVSFSEDGAARGSRTFTGALSTNAIGGLISLSTLYVHGDIAEIILYNRSLSAAERDDVHRYVTRKYGIPMTLSDGTVATQ